MAKVNSNRVFEDYLPPSDLVTQEEFDTLLIYLPGFKKEQLRVQLTPSGVLKISGERPIGDNKYRRFHKEFQVPPNCDTKQITAKFEGGILNLRQPKLTTPSTAPLKQQIPEMGKKEETRVEEKAKEDEEAMKKEKEEMGSKDEERKQKSGVINRSRKVVNSELYRELRKPDNLKKFGVCVLLVLIIGFFVSNMFKPFMGIEHNSLMAYDQEL